MAINNEYVPIDNQPTIKPRTISGIFTRYIAKTLPLAFDESMSYYECLCALLDYINTKVIPALDNNAEGLLELQEFYLELQTYVNDYFKNLDVQEEINNKLDDMVEAGTLDQIIEQYLNSSAIWGFNSIADMKEATNLIDGSYAKTLGYYEKNDGGSALYKIRTITNDDVVDDMFIIAINDDSLIAELIYDLPLDVRKIGFKNDGTLISNNIRDGLLKEKSFIFKDGEYNFNQLIIDDVTEYNLYGENATLSDNSSFDIRDSSNIIIEKLNFNNNTNNVFIFRDCQNVKVENCNFTNSETATIRMIRTTGNICKNFKFINNNFKDVSKTNSWGGALYIDGQGKNGSDDTTETLPIEQIEVRGNLFETIGTAGVNFGGVKDAIVDSNIFRDSYGTQNMLSTYNRESTNLVITNNTFSGCGWECCILNYCNNAVISNNYMEDFAYGVTIENECSNISINSNTLDGKYGNRTHTEGFQANTFGILLKDSEYINVNNNNIKVCRNGIHLDSNLNNITINGNIIDSSYNGVAYGGTNSSNDNINILNNNISNMQLRGLYLGGQKINVINNNILNCVTAGIVFEQITATSNLKISNNRIVCDVGIDETSINNIDCYQEITNNIINATTIIKSTFFNTNIGFIKWYNPSIILPIGNICYKFTKGSIVLYNENDFSGVPTGQTATVSYFLKGEVGCLYVTADGTWRRKTGGGGASVTTFNTL